MTPRRRDAKGLTFHAFPSRLCVSILQDFEFRRPIAGCRSSKADDCNIIEAADMIAARRLYQEPCPDSSNHVGSLSS